MASKLTTYVHAVERDDKGNPGRSQVFGPGDDVPGWARSVISNPDVWDSAEEAERVELAEPGEPERLTMPNKAGAGSSLEAWQSYAAQEGVETPDGASRTDIIAAVEAAQQ